MLPKIAHQPLRTDSLSWLPFSESIQQMLRIPSKFGDVVDLSVVKGDLIGVPRNCANLGVEDARVKKTKIAINCLVPPRNTEQTRVINEIVVLLCKGVSHVFQATTGFGKTYCALHVASRIKQPTLIVVTKEDLMEQWREAILKYTDVKLDEIGTIQQDVCDYKGKKIVLGMVHSLAKDKYPQEVKDYFGLVIFDEVHRMGAETFSESCGMFTAELRLGLSATPTRIDGKEFVIAAHIGEVLVCTAMNKMPPKVLFQKTGWKLPILKQRVFQGGIWQSITGPLRHEPGRMMGVYKAMAKDPGRNQMLVDFIYAAWKKGRRTIVFSDLKESHLEVLFHMCVKKGIPVEVMAYYVGGMSEKARAAAKQALVLFATYAMTAEATDIPWLDTAVLATPRSNVTQTIGRILREYPDKKEPVVYDPVDECSSILMAFMSKRRTDYHKLGAKLLQL